MKRLSRFKKYVKENLAKIHLVDKCLILFMMVLLVQSAHNLLSPYPVYGELASIDIIVRTSCAAVFGYFLSANFIRHSSLSKEAPQETPRIMPAAPTPAEVIQPVPRETPQIMEEAPAPVDTLPAVPQEAPRNMPEIPAQEAEISAAPQATPTAFAPQEAVQETGRDAPQEAASRLQIMVATIIGLFCLLVLILFRDVPGLAEHAENSPSATATVAQMRDFISGCVGFLIGCPTSRGKQG